MTQQSEPPTKKPLLFPLLVLGETIGLAHLVHIFRPRDSGHYGTKDEQQRNGVASQLEAGAVLKQKDEHLPAQKEPVLEYDEELDSRRPITLARAC
jgi:hypothetical protein